MNPRVAAVSAIAVAWAGLTAAFPIGIARAESPDCSTVPSGTAAWSKSNEGACRIQPPSPSPSVSMKGWELYSWRDHGRWKYALLEGTNGIKIGAEVKLAGTSDLTAIEARLRGLPPQTTISWNPPQTDARLLKLEKPGHREPLRRELDALCDGHPPR